MFKTSKKAPSEREITCLVRAIFARHRNWIIYLQNGPNGELYIEKKWPVCLHNKKRPIGLFERLTTFGVHFPTSFYHVLVGKSARWYDCKSLSSLETNRSRNSDENVFKLNWSRFMRLTSQFQLQCNTLLSVFTWVSLLPYYQRKEIELIARVALCKVALYLELTPFCCEMHYVLPRNWYQLH